MYSLFNCHIRYSYVESCQIVKRVIGCNVTFRTAFDFSNLHTPIFVTSNGLEMPSLNYLHQVALYIHLYHETQFCFFQ